MSADLDTDPRAGAVRRRFRDVVMEHGEPYDAKVVEIIGEAGDCWTHAWHVATTTPDRTYVEGVCLVRGQVHAHAWTIDATGVVHEHTEGYERAGCYVGIPIDTGPASEARKINAHLPPGRRCSMIEGLLSTPADPLTIIARLRP